MIDNHASMDYLIEMKKGLTYSQSGVNIDEGQRLVDLIKPFAKETSRGGVMGNIGGFGSLFSGSFKGLKDPVLVSSTDGVGTKLKVAFLANRHNTVGIDLVAMCVNDIVTTGAEPLFFLDYLATGRLKAARAATIIKGIAKGCKEAGCALIGGETAEMPGIYSGDDYDLAGFAVGVVEQKKIIDGKGVRPGDSIIGLASSGLHSNGYSLARKVFFERLRLKTTDRPRGLGSRGLGRSVGAELLTPTRIYVKPLLGLAKKIGLRGLAHITGGGLTENLPRAFGGGLKARIETGSWKVLPVFNFIREKGRITEDEMLRTFNMGVGMAILVKRTDEARTLRILRGFGEKPSVIGRMEKRKKHEALVEFTRSLYP